MIHFYKKGWLSGHEEVQKKTINVAKDETLCMSGIGATWQSFRYWLQAVGLTEEPSSGKRVQTFTSLGNSVFKMIAA